MSTSWRDPPAVAGHAAFAKLFPESDELLRGAYATLRPHTGLLREDRGAAYEVRSTDYAFPPDGDHRDAIGHVTREPTRRLFALAGGTVRGRDGAVVDPASGVAVRESLDLWDEPLDRHPALRPDGFDPVERLPGTSLLIATLGGDGFFHFLLEALPKLVLARDVLPACRTVLVAGDSEPWRLAWLAKAGVDPGRIRWLGPRSHLACDQLLFTNRLVRHFEPNPWVVAALRGLLALPPPTPRPDGPVLWLDRSAAPHRRRPWEGELHRLAAPDAVPIDLGSLSPEAVVTACAGARAFAGLHGAAFANLVFAAPGARVLEFQPEPFAPWYARLADTCGQRHLAVPVTAETMEAAAAAGRMFLDRG